MCEIEKLNHIKIHILFLCHLCKPAIFIFLLSRTKYDLILFLQNGEKISELNNLELFLFYFAQFLLILIRTSKKLFIWFLKTFIQNWAVLKNSCYF